MLIEADDGKVYCNPVIGKGYEWIVVFEPEGAFLICDSGIDPIRFIEGSCFELLPKEPIKLPIYSPLLFGGATAHYIKVNGPVPAAKILEHETIDS